MLRSNYAEFTTENLIRLFQDEKDDQAFDQLLKNYYHLIYGTCLKFIQQEADAKDLTSDITILIWEKLPAAEVNNFNSWLFSICKNACMDFHRTKKKSLEENISNELLEESLVAETTEPYEKGGIDRPSNIKELELLMASLPNREKACLRLFYIKKLSYEKIQTKTGYSYNEIKTALHSARNKLRSAVN